MSLIKLKINGIECEGQSGDTILDVAKRYEIDIPTLCHDEKVKYYGACGLCVVEISGSPKLARACSTTIRDGIEVLTESEKVVKTRKAALELLMSDHDGDCRGPCMLNCPAGTDCQRYVKKIAEGEIKEAVKIIKEKIPLPASIGRVCPHPCETACRRKMVEDPISIATLKYYAADKDLESDDKYIPEKKETTGKKVSVIGGGPAGLSAAYFLTLKGHDCQIFDMMPKMGGMLRYGIPQYRLPKEVLDKEIESIKDLGVKMTNDIRIGKDISFEEIKNNSDAVILSIGAWKSSPLRCEGENLKNVYGGIDFLREIALGNKPYLGKSTVIVGGGNTAMDASRSAIRLGCENVYLVYRRTREEMPAENIEIEEAIQEGVKFKFLRNPSLIEGNGKVEKIKLQVMELGAPDATGRRSPVPIEGEFELLEVDSVISAIGQKVDVSGFEEIELNKWNIISADTDNFSTSVEKVFAIGDDSNKGADIAVSAIGEAQKASEVIDSFLCGNMVSYKKPYLSEMTVTDDMFKDREKLSRIKSDVKSPKDRKNNFDEFVYSLTDEQAKKEASRCLECGCHDYFECSLIKHANRYDIFPDKYKGDKRKTDSEKKLTVIERNNGKCILCSLCVRTCDEVAKQGLLGLVGRGFSTTIKPEFQNTSATDICKNCYKCVNACPTGALKII